MRSSSAFSRKQGDQRQMLIDAAALHLRQLLEQQLNTLRADMVGQLEKLIGETTERFLGSSGAILGA